MQRERIRITESGSGYVVFVDHDEYAVRDTLEDAKRIRGLLLLEPLPWDHASRVRILGPVSVERPVEAGEKVNRWLQGASRGGKSAGPLLSGAPTEYGVDIHFDITREPHFIQGSTPCMMRAEAVIFFAPAHPAMARAEVMEAVVKLIQKELFSNARRGGAASGAGDPVSTDPERSGGGGAVEPGSERGET